MFSRTVLLLMVLLQFCAAGAARAGDPPALGLLADAVDVAELDGKVVYVDFWASWCAPCQTSFPWMAELHERRAKDGLVILAVNVDRKEEAVSRFLDGRNVPFRIVRDPEGKLAAEFDLKAMPTAFVFDRDGRLQWTHEGFRESEAPEVAAKLDELLDLPAKEPGE